MSLGNSVKFIGGIVGIYKAAKSIVSTFNWGTATAQNWGSATTQNWG
jgi:hypothetical protein